MSKYLTELAHAPQTEEPDRAQIRWRKRTWVLTKGETSTRPRTRRPDPKVYYTVLREAGRNLCVCELCNSDERITVHHRDGNPFNNKLENLQVLCWNCHLVYHDPTEEGVRSELEGTKTDANILDDERTRGFYGITQEE